MKRKYFNGPCSDEPRDAEGVAFYLEDALNQDVETVLVALRNQDGFLKY